MVSFFGLRLGGEKKKKKPEQPAGNPGQPKQRADQNLMGEGQYFGRDFSHGGSSYAASHGGSSYAASIYSTTKSRPVSPHSYKVSALSRKKQSVYSSDTHNLAAVSMLNLSLPGQGLEPALPVLKSNPNLGMCANNWSMSSFEARPVLDSRPSTAGGPAGKQRAWVNPLDIHFVKSPPPGAILPPSSLPNHRLHGANTSIAGTTGNVPHLPQTSESRNPPPRPRSVGQEETHPVIERPIFFGNQVARPSTSGSRKMVPAGLATLQMSNDSTTFGPISFPSPPPSLPLAVDDKKSSVSSQRGQPVIQNVRAKRETMAFSAARNRSLEMNIEVFARSKGVDYTQLQGQRPATAHGQSPQRSHAPPPWDWNQRGSREAEVVPHYRPASPPGGYRPHRDGIPTAAFGAYGGPARPDTTNARHPAEEHHLAKQDSDTSMYSTKSRTADSPVFSHGTPFASRRDMPIMSLPQAELDNDFRFPDWSALAEDSFVSQYVEKAASGTRVTNHSPNPSTSSWPLPPPGVIRPTVTKGPALETVRATATRNVSPFAISSFSRPRGNHNRTGARVITTDP